LRPVTGFSVAGRRLVLSEAVDPLPEVRWAGRAWRRGSLSGALELVRSGKFDPETEVALPGAADVSPPPGANPARITVETAGPDEAAATVEAGGAGHVVLSRTYFRSWKGRLDGLDAPVLVANARDLAIAVPAGRHRVEFRYDRSPFQRGVSLQALALLAVAAAVFLRR
jgi:hypothetical protein